jgi:hypothetical protein
MRKEITSFLEKKSRLHLLSKTICSTLILSENSVGNNDFMLKNKVPETLPL